MSIHKTASATFARPANTTAYTAGDIVANHATGANVVPPPLRVSGIPGRGGRVRQVLLAKSAALLTNASFRVHLFSSAPVITSGDNAAMAVAGIAAGYVGSADVVMDKNFSDAAYDDAGVDLPFQLPEGGRDLFAVVEALGSYVPASGETFTVRVGVERD